MIKRVIDIALAALTTVLLAFGLFGSGLVVCMIPETTQLLGKNFSNWENATYPEETMETLAEAVRSFSVEGSERSSLEDAVNQALSQNYPGIQESIASGIAGQSSTQTGATTATSTGLSSTSNSSYNTGSNSGSSAYAGETTSTNGANNSSTGTSSSSSTNTTGLGISNLISIYTLSSSALDHLEDCVSLFTTSRIGIILSLVFALVGIMLLIIRRRRKVAGWIMFLTPLAVIAGTIVFGVAAFIDFDSLFETLHGLFFTSGTWVFPANSLLINLFPESFWMGMGVVWVAVSIICCLLCCLIGKFLKR
jgi:integral membrane protein (TIGR01906 family)